MYVQKTIYNNNEPRKEEGDGDMERNMLKELLRWNNDPLRKPLIIYGARQTGKTTLVRDIFARTYYPQNTIYIDLNLERDIRQRLLDTVDPDEIIEYLEFTFERKISKDTLLIFDEVQECLSVVTALKYFAQDHREIPVIVTGSMVRIKIFREEKNKHKAGKTSFFFPVGAVDELTLYPMSFDEYLINTNRGLYEEIVNGYTHRKPLKDYVHEKAMNELYKYLLVGGMPEALSVFINTGSVLEARKVQKALFDNYLNDMKLYQASSESVVRSQAVYKNIYRQLNKDAKNFRASLIRKDSKTRDFTSALDWLTEARTVYRSVQVKETVTYPLMPEDDYNFRLYLSDVGFFTVQSGVSMTSFIDSKTRNTLSGIFFENYVACELKAKGLELFYWRGKNDAEFEFLVSSDGEIYPLDVKKGKGVMNSMEKYRYHNTLKYAIKVSGNQFGINSDNRVVTVPLYEVFLLANDLANDRLSFL